MEIRGGIARYRFSKYRANRILSAPLTVVKKEDMMLKHLLSVTLVTFVLAGCGTTPEGGEEQAEAKSNKSGCVVKKTTRSRIKRTVCR